MRVDYTPNFDSGILAEPLLAFGGGHKHVDPKIGLGLYGPYTLAGQPRPELTSITVGIVGPGSMIADTEQWLKACQTILTNDGSQPFLYPHFPGFSSSHPFQCELIFGDTGRKSLPIKIYKQLYPQRISMSELKERNSCWRIHFARGNPNRLCQHYFRSIFGLCLKTSRHSVESFFSRPGIFDFSSGSELPVHLWLPIGYAMHSNPPREQLYFGQFYI